LPWIAQSMAAVTWASVASRTGSAESPAPNASRSSDERERVDSVALPLAHAGGHRNRVGAVGLDPEISQRGLRPQPKVCDRLQ
jgi:hypothetical protein